jgi:hypothetical protein
MNRFRVFNDFELSEPVATITPKQLQPPTIDISRLQWVSAKEIVIDGETVEKVFSGYGLTGIATTNEALQSAEGNTLPLSRYHRYTVTSANELYDELYKGSTAVVESKKEWSETTLTVAKQIRIDYEVVEPYSHSDNNKNSSKSYNDEKSEKINDNNKEKNQNIYVDFGQSTPLSLLLDKYYIYAVSRINKYSINSPQPYISILNKYNKIGNENNNNYLCFDLDRLNINHFSLWIEKIDKLDSSKSSETRDKQ